MSTANQKIIERIKSASEITGIPLKTAVRSTSLNYQTLAKQVREERKIPAEALLELAPIFGLPISYFLPQLATASAASTATSLANEANRDRAKITRAGFEVTTDHVLDWYRENNGILQNHHWFEDQLDLYEPIKADDQIMNPIFFGENSITTERLMLSSKQDFYNTVAKFGKERIDKAMESHRMVQSHDFVVSDEVIDARVKGQYLRGGWRKITMRTKTPEGLPMTAVFSKLTWIGS